MRFCLLDNGLRNRVVVCQGHKWQAEGIQVTLGTAVHVQAEAATS